MKIATILFNIILFLRLPQCTGVPACCADPINSCCGTPVCTGGPPPPPGFPIDNYIWFLIFVALIFGVYTIIKNKSKLSV